MNSSPKFSESNNFSFIGFLSALFIASQSLSSFGQGINFERIAGTFNIDEGRSIIQTLDSCYVFAGSTSGFGNGQSDVYLTKLAKTGLIVWQQAIGGTGIDKGRSLIQTSDSGFAVVGYSNSSGSGGYDVYLARTDKNGSLLWENTYGGFDWDFGNSIIQTTAGDFVICGSTYSYGHGNEDVYLLKTDSTGVLLWDSAYGGSQEDAGSSVCTGTDGGYFIAGTTKSFGAGEKDVFLVKTDPDGNLNWMKTYGDTADDIGNDGKLATDGGFIIAASTERFFKGMHTQNWFVKTNSSGDTLWTRRDTASFNRVATSVCVKRPDGGFLFAGQDDGAGQYNMFLYMTDAWGYFQAYHNYGGGSAEDAYSISQTYDDGYILVGTTQSYGPGTPNVYALKTADDLWSNGGVINMVGISEDELPKNYISVFPNPVSDRFTVNAEKNSVLEIFDPLGRCVSVNPIIRGKNTVVISGLPDGIYFIQVRDEKHTASGKIIVRH